MSKMVKNGRVIPQQQNLNHVVFNQVGVVTGAYSAVAFSSQQLRDFGTTQEAACTVYFRDIEARLIEHIRSADAVVGAVAWFASKQILEAFRDKKAVAIIVQKEDFLRPDTLPDGDASKMNRKQWARWLRRQYEGLHAIEKQYLDRLGPLFVENFQQLAAVRCCGVNNSNNNTSMPRMHNKFVVFCRYHGEQTEQW